MDHLDDGPVDAGVESDDQHAAHQAQDGTSQAHPVAPAPASLAVADGGQQDGSPATQEIVPGAGNGGLRLGVQARSGAHVSHLAAFLPSIIVTVRSR